MSSKAAITVLRAREDVESMWRDSDLQPSFAQQSDNTVKFVDAPGDRGTEIHVEIKASPPAGKLGEAVQKVTGTEPLAKVKDELRRFKQRVETGEITRSEASPEGELLERKLKQRPAQPLSESELQKAGV